jgi:hypothetical protein
MNKRQRKKAGFKPRPSKTVRRNYWKYVRSYELNLNYAVDEAIKRMTVQECRDGDFFKINEAAEEVARGFIPCSNPWGEMKILTITRQLPAAIHKVKINVLLSM